MQHRPKNFKELKAFCSQNGGKCAKKELAVKSVNKLCLPKFVYANAFGQEKTAILSKAGQK